jgi:hypothetical protein
MSAGCDSQPHLALTLHIVANLGIAVKGVVKKIPPPSEVKERTAAKPRNVSG